MRMSLLQLLSKAKSRKSFNSPIEASRALTIPRGLGPSLWSSKSEDLKVMQLKLRKVELSLRGLKQINDRKRSELVSNSLS